MVNGVSVTDEQLRSSRDPRFCLHPQVRLRREAFGGIAFHRKTGRLVEVDDEAFALLTLLARGNWSLRDLAATARCAFNRRLPVPEVARIVEALVVRAILEQDIQLPGDGRVPGHYCDAPAYVPSLHYNDSALSSPITVHWAISYSCGLTCPHCYTLAFGGRRELSRVEKLRVVERLAAWRVLEVALGGGEPTDCPDLEELLQAIRAAGMVPNVTTNGQNMSRTQAKALAENCGRIQVSLDRPEILDSYRGSGAARRAFGTATLLGDSAALVGANLLLVPENIRTIEQSLWFFQEQGIAHVVLLRPFGDCSGRWPRGWPSESDWTVLRSSLREWTAAQPDMSLEIACGLSVLLDDLPAKDCRARPAFGCSGGRRFLALLSDGTMLRCSHLFSPGHQLGHVLRDDPEVIWRRAQSISGSRVCRRKQ